MQKHNEPVPTITQMLARAPEGHTPFEIRAEMFERILRVPKFGKITLKPVANSYIDPNDL